MAQGPLALPPPTMFGSKPIQQRTQDLQIYIQVPCQFAKYVVEKWDIISPNALILLVSQEEQTDQITKNVEYLRVLDIQNQLIFSRKLSELKWGQLAGLAYELDTFHEDGALDNVYAVTFSTEQNVAEFNKKFDDAMNRPLANVDELLPFFKPLTDAIERGDVTEAIKRFNFLCGIPQEKRRLKIVAEKPLTAEEIKQKNTVNISISVENNEGLEIDISLRVPKTAKIGDLREIMYTTYEIPLEVQKWLGEQCLYKNSETVLDSKGEPKKIYLYILNAAKVGLNHTDFMAKLESQRQALKAKKEDQQQQQLPLQPQRSQPPQPLLPSHEEEVPFSQWDETPYSPPLDPGAGSYYPSDPSQTTVSSVDPNDSEQVPTIPGVVWGCPKCNHINPWVCMRCERCRIPKDEAI